MQQDVSYSAIILDINSPPKEAIDLKLLKGHKDKQNTEFKSMIHVKNNNVNYYSFYDAILVGEKLGACYYVKEEGGTYFFNGIYPSSIQEFYNEVKKNKTPSYKFFTNIEHLISEFNDRIKGKFFYSPAIKKDRFIIYYGDATYNSFTMRGALSIGTENFQNLLIDPKNGMSTTFPEGVLDPIGLSPWMKQNNIPVKKIYWKFMLSRLSKVKKVELKSEEAEV